MINTNKCCRKAQRSASLFGKWNSSLPTVPIEMRDSASPKANYRPQGAFRGERKKRPVRKALSDREERAHPPVQGEERAWPQQGRRSKEEEPVRCRGGPQ